VNVTFLPPLDQTKANVFKVGQTIPVKVQLANACNGTAVTSGVTASVDVSLRDGSGAEPYELPEIYNGVGDVGSVMRLVDDHYHYNLQTGGGGVSWPSATNRTQDYYRIDVTVRDDLYDLGSAGVNLESR
jgi:hypothetical protein